MVAVVEACDVTNNGRHLGFYRELEIRLKPREMVFFLVLHEKYTLQDFSHNIYLLLLLKKVEKHVFSPPNGLNTCYL